MKRILITDVEKCLACKSCEIACALAHSDSKVLEEAINESPLPQKRVMVESAEEFAVPMQCRHCEDAPCVEICPSQALHKEKSSEQIFLEQERCIGCQCCLIVCPFGVIVPSHDGRVVVKCDLCLERLQAGQEPACVESCPTGAIKFVEADQFVKEKRDDAAQRLINEKKD